MTKIIREVLVFVDSVAFQCNFKVLYCIKYEKKLKKNIAGSSQKHQLVLRILASNL